MTSINKKILLITFEFPPQRGGMQNYYYNLAKSFEPAQIVVLTLPDATAGDFDRQQNFKIIRRELLHKYFRPRWSKMLSIIKKIIEEENIDLLWVGDILPVGQAALKLGIPYFVSLHGLDIMLAQKSPRKHEIARKILEAAKFVTFNSRFTEALLQPFGLSKIDSAVIYPCSVHQPQFVPEQRVLELKRELGIKNEKIILTVGRLVKRKGHELVIKALPEILEKVSDVKYFIVGSGPEHDALKELVGRLNLWNSVMFFNLIDDYKLPCFYGLAKIFVMTPLDLPDDPEGFGLVYLEAAGFAKPSVAGKYGGVSEAVLDGQTGILVDPQKQSELAQAIVKLLLDEGLAKQLGQNAKDRASREFNWQEQSDKLKEIINRI